jgi:pimeloyl-ACP methyl ester carboxylesterase
VRHPERVSGLILYGGFVKGWRLRGDRNEIATHEAMTTLIREGWGKNNPVFRHLFTTMFIPGANQEQMDWFDELQRLTVSPWNACRLHEAFGEIDVSDVLSQVTAPTLVLHARLDAAVPFQSGREFATGIPGARFVDLDSANHILLAGEPAFEQLVREVNGFVAQTS